MTKDHRTTGIGRDLRGSSSPTPLLKQVPYSKLPRKASRCVLYITREGDFTTSLGSLFQCSVTHNVKKFCRFV